ncbi:MAG: tetratricopeptide repeat protein [Bryobacteraceae bacterium]|nr:tetratricopeptide repeat protein [Bryobacteraceae bacterium]
MRRPSWPVWAGLAAAAFAALLAYAPAIAGPFVFDDRYLPFMHPAQQQAPLMNWLLGVRPTLMFSYWLNYRTDGVNPLWYHIANVLLHLGAALMVFLIARKFLAWSGADGWRRDAIAVFAGGLFLLHPLQTEAVAYIASRSENLSVFLCYGALAVFLYRKTPSISFPRALAVLALFAGAVTTKEHTAVLPLLLLMTDYYWNPGFSFQAIRRNWRLYAPMAAAGAAGMLFVWNTLRTADTAGFSLKGLSWYEYFYTQCRAIWIYVRMFFLPYGQSVDHDYPMAKSWLEPGTLAGFLGLCALVAAALLLRKKYRLASYGILAFLLLLAPTSSFVPIRDALVERRFYLPSIGLLLVVADLAARWRASRATVAAAMAAVLLACGVLTYRRNEVWSDSIALWKDAAAKSPGNWRAHFQLAYAYFENQRCAEAVEEYTKAGELDQSDVRLFVNWALAYDCAGRPEAALTKLLHAAKMEPSAHVYSQAAMIYGKQGRSEEALAALDAAEKLQPDFAMLYVYRGNVYFNAGDPARAAAEYRRALAIDGSLDVARRALMTAELRMKQPPR